MSKDAHWQLDKGELHGQAARWIFERTASQLGITMAEEVDLGLVTTSHAKNTSTNRSGSSPAQWDTGRNLRLPAALLSEGENPDAMSAPNDSHELQRINLIRSGALHKFLSYESNQGFMNAMLRQGRHARGPFEPGQGVAYWHDDSGLQPQSKTRRVDIEMSGYRKGILLLQDKEIASPYYVRSDLGKIVLVAPEQLRGVEGEEL